MNKKIIAIVVFQLLLLVNMSAVLTLAEESPQWPSAWTLIEADDLEDSGKIYRDVSSVFYSIDDDYIYFRLECYGDIDFTSNPKARYKWFIDTDNVQNMNLVGGTVSGQEYILFVEDSLPAPNGDGNPDIFLLEDIVGDDGLITKADYPDYLTNPGPILDTDVANCSIDGGILDMWINQSEIGYPTYSYFTWATDQADPNLNSAPNLDRSDFYWESDFSKADISIVKEDNVDYFTHPGASFSYTINVTNHGPHTGENINVTDVIPAGVTYKSANPQPNGNIGSKYYWLVESINASDSYIIEINVTVDAGFTGTIINTVNAINDTRDPYQINNVYNEETVVIGVADLSISKFDSIDPIVSGNNLTYTINVTNNGPNTAVDINISDILPAEVTYFSANPEPTYQNGQNLYWNESTLADLPAGESILIQVNVTVHNGTIGIITNNAQVTSTAYDPELSNNECFEETLSRGISDLSMNKTSYYTTPVYAGDTIKYMLNVTNHGPDKAINVNVTDVLPAGVTYKSANPQPNGNIASNYYWLVESINANDSYVIEINVTVDTGFTGTIINTAYVDEDSHDPDEGNDEDEEEIIVEEEITGDDDDDDYTPPGDDDDDDYTPPVGDDDDDYFFPGGGGVQYLPPTAGLNGPYYGVPGEEVRFNGRASHDNDEDGEKIVEYQWKFSDEDPWVTDADEIAVHIYMEPGIYNVSLRVVDDEGEMDTKTVHAIIIQPNQPPSTPELTGPQNGTENTTYEFEVFSTDEDNETIQYTIEWGDNTSDTSEFLPSGEHFKATHSWMIPGNYIITVTADDNDTITTEEFEIEITEPEPRTYDLDQTNILLVLLPLLALLFLLLLLLDKRRKDKKKANEEQKKKPKK